MDCAVCKAPNPEGARYCSACGARLNSIDSIDAAALQDAVRCEVEAALKRDQKELQIAEFDITERVANRLISWGKSLAVVLGALLLLGGFLGVKSAVDVLRNFRAETKALVNTATDEVKRTTDTLETNVNAQQLRLNQLKTTMDATQKDLDALHNTFGVLNSEKTDIDRQYAQLKEELPHLKEIRNTLARYGSQLSDQHQVIDVLSQQVQALIQDEASRSNRSAQSFPAAEVDYFHNMDRGIALTPDEIKGRNTWLVWTGGNDQFWDFLTTYSSGYFDLLKILSSHPTLKYSRDNRWSFLGLLNEPCFAKATGPKPGAFGLWLDVRRSDCPLDPFEDERKYPGVALGARGKAPVPLGSYYGFASGVVGLRLFPNPDFDEIAAKNWDPERYYTDPAYYTRNNLVRPYRVGISCGFCHVGFNPEKPPVDPENPLWDNLSSVTGNQFFWMDRIVNPRVDPSNYFFQLVQSYRPGTLDTSLVVTDYVNNPHAITPIYNLGARLYATKRWNKDQWSKAIIDDSEPISSRISPGIRRTSPCATSC